MEYRRDAVFEALQIDRRLVAEEPTDERRYEFGETLLLAAEVMLSQGRAGTGRGVDAKALTESAQFAVEARGVLETLQQERKLAAAQADRLQYARLVEKQAREALAGPATN